MKLLIKLCKFDIQSFKLQLNSDGDVGKAIQVWIVRKQAQQQQGIFKYLAQSSGYISVSVIFCVQLICMKMRNGNFGRQFCTNFGPYGTKNIFSPYKYIYTKKIHHFSSLLRHIFIPILFERYKKTYFQLSFQTHIHTKKDVILDDFLMYIKTNFARYKNTYFYTQGIFISKKRHTLIHLFICILMPILDGTKQNFNHLLRCT